MSNFKSTSLVKTQSPIVLSFDISKGAKKYYFGFSLSDDNNSQISHQLRVTKGSIQHYFQGKPSWEETTNSTILYNTNGKLFDDDLIVLQSHQSTNYFVSTTQSPDGGLYYSFKVNQDDNNQVSLYNLNLNYNSYISSKQFYDQETCEQVFVNNQTFYGTQFNTIPVMFDCENQQNQTCIILLQNNTYDTIFLTTDFGIEIPNDAASFTTVHSVMNTIDQEEKITSNIITSDVIKEEFNKVRFVISDYGRIISHSIKTISNPNDYQQTSYIIFDTNKLQKPISIRFGVDNDSSISNITSNF